MPTCADPPDDDAYWEWLIQLHLACERLDVAERTAIQSPHHPTDARYAVMDLQHLVDRAGACAGIWPDWQRAARGILAGRAGEFLPGDTRPPS